MQNKMGRWLYALWGIGFMYASGLFTFFYLDYTTARAMPTIPIVSISETHVQNPVTADHSVVVFGQANDPDGIVETQLWVNGQMVASQTNPDPGSGQPFDVRQAWIPTGVANYLVFYTRLTEREDYENHDTQDKFFVGDCLAPNSILYAQRYHHGSL